MSVCYSETRRTKGEFQHVPYRSSKLTMALKVRNPRVPLSGCLEDPSLTYLVTGRL